MNEFSVWIGEKALRMSIREEDTRCCPGMDDNTLNCMARPEFVLHYKENVTGYPEMADDCVVTVCRDHLAEELHRATVTTYLVGAVTVSRYNGK